MSRTRTERNPIQTSAVLIEPSPRSWSARPDMIEMFRRLRALLRAGDWLNSRRVIRWSGILLTLEILAFLFFVAGTHGHIVKLEKPTTTDFVSFYAAGILANSNKPDLAYSQADHYEAEQNATEPGIAYNFFFYPPVFLLLCSVLARLPYLLAFVVFEIISCLLYIFVTQKILCDQGWIWLVPLMAFPSVLWTFGFGQNSFLTAAIFGAATLLLDRQPLMAGATLGLLSYKPHFGLLIPIALVAGRQWKAFVATGLSAAFLVGLSGLFFGWDTWRAFLTTFSGSGSVFAGGRIPFAGLVSVFGAARLTGLSVRASYIIQAAFALEATLTVGMIWHRGCSPSVRFASLIAGTLLAIPVVLIYDLVLLAVAGCWLIKAGRGTRFLPWEKTGLLVAFLVPIFSRSVGLSLHIPVGPLAAVILLTLCLFRAWRERQQQSMLAHE